MQGKDEDLYTAYRQIDELEKRALNKDVVILRLVIVCISLALVIIGILVLAVVKGYVKMKLPVRL